MSWTTRPPWLDDEDEIAESEYRAELFAIELERARHASALSPADDLAGPADLDFSGAAESPIPVPLQGGLRHVHHTSRRTRALRGAGGAR